MTRFIITLLAFAIPFALYGLYVAVQRRRRREGARDPWPIAVLWLTGAVLAVETLALTAVTQPPGGGVYYPSRLEDGRIVPYHYGKRPDGPPPRSPTAPPETP